MESQTQDALNRITDEKWREIISHLRRYASKKMAILPLWMDVNDIVSDAIASVLNETRTWNMTRYPELIDQLTAIIDSLYSALWKSKRAQKTEASQKRIGLDAVENQLQASEEDASFTEYCRERLQSIRSAIIHDEELQYFVMAIEEGHYKSKEIAEALGWPVKQVYNARKRLDRIIEGLENKTPR